MIILFNIDNKKWETKYQEILQINNDNSKKLTTLLEEKNNYLEKCNVIITDYTD